jgi:predicted DNA-binding protein
MPSRNPRLALTVPPDVRAAIDELAEAVGKPSSTVVVELLAEMVPQMQGLAKVARAAKSGNKAAAKRALAHMLGDSMAELMAVQQPDMFAGGKARSR